MARRKAEAIRCFSTIDNEAFQGQNDLTPSDFMLASTGRERFNGS
jgi:hypothetical protein